MAGADVVLAGTAGTTAVKGILVFAALLRVGRPHEVLLDADDLEMGKKIGNVRHDC